MPDLVQRFDTSRFDAVERTPQGGVRVPARLTRTGVFDYVREDGSIQREYRPPEEVFHADTMSSLEDAPVTDLHPDEGFVEPANYSRLSRGHARDGRRDGDFVAATLVVQDSSLADAIERKDRSEISLGYRCRLDMTPGTTPNGERYDAVQRGIVINHVAVGPKDWGRAGPDVKVRLDSKMNATPTGARKEKPMAKPKTGARRDNDDVPAKPEETTDAETVAVPGEACPCCAQMVPVKKDEDAPEPAPVEKADARTRARLDALEASNKQLVKELSEARDTKRVDAAAKELVQLRELARDVGVKKLDGLTTDEIKRAVVSKAYPSIKLDGKSAAYIDGLVEAAREQRSDNLVSDQRRTVEGHDDSDDDSDEREDGGDDVHDFFAQLNQQARHGRNGED